MTFINRNRWGLCLSTFGFLLIGIGVFSAAWWFKRAEAMGDKFDQILTGMSIDEVTAIMQAAPAAQLEEVDEDWYFDIWVWQLAGYRIEIYFTQPPDRADRDFRPEWIASDGIGRVHGKWLKGGMSDLLDRLEAWIYEDD